MHLYSRRAPLQTCTSTLDVHIGGDGHRLNRDLICTSAYSEVSGLPEVAPPAVLDPPVLDAALHAVSNDEHRVARRLEGRVPRVRVRVWVWVRVRVIGEGEGEGEGVGVGEGDW